MLNIVILVALVSISLVCGSGVIHHLNESEYSRMPPVFHLDHYQECVQEGGEYCSLKIQLVSDQPSHLLKTIQQYSAIRTHFNHSLLNYGICVTKTCEYFPQTNTTRGLVESLEGCLNKTMWKDYRLRTKLIEEPSCHKAGENGERISVVDVIITVFLGVVVVLNLVGTVREFIVSEKNDSIFSSFSLKRNWLILTGPSRVTDPRMEGTKAFSGIRSITSMIVISSHSLLPYYISGANTRDWEEGYKYMKYVGTGSLIIQTFFTMSGFLMAYNTTSHEKESIERCLSLMSKILRRWLRLAPPYLVVLALTMSWIRFAGSGPMWQLVVGDHIEACRRNWWLVPLNIINYADHTQCFIEYWYIAADMQLSALGLLIFGFLRGRARWWTLGFLLLASLIVPVVHTWLQGLDGWLMLTPEFSRTVFLQNPATDYTMDPTFTHVYKRGHTNIAAYIIGAALGLLVSRWQRDHAGKHCDAFQKYRFVYWLTFPLILATVLVGGVFFDLETAPPLYVRVGYCMMARLVFSGSVAVLLAGLTLKMENLYRSICSWDTWNLTARLSYCAYVLHVALIRIHAGSQFTLAPFSFINATWLILGTELATFLVAVPLWLFVEAPTAALMKHLARRSTSDEPADNTSIEEEHTAINLHKVNEMNGRSS